MGNSEWNWSKSHLKVTQSRSYSIKVTRTTRVSITNFLATTGQVFECSKGFKACKGNSRMCLGHVMPVRQRSQDSQ